MFLKLVTQALILNFFAFCLIDAQGLIINTRNGPVRGTQSWFGPKIINEWLGIPYAQPPVGQLRFRRPVPVNNWCFKSFAY
jgi:hypothetical protein